MSVGLWNNTNLLRTDPFASLALGFPPILHCRSIICFCTLVAWFCGDWERHFQSPLYVIVLDPDASCKGLRGQHRSCFWCLLALLDSPLLDSVWIHTVGHALFVILYYFGNQHVVFEIDRHFGEFPIPELLYRVSGVLTQVSVYACLISSSLSERLLTRDSFEAW